MLTERFKMSIRRESRMMPVYDLVVAKGGPKLKESAPCPDGAAPPPAAPEKSGPDENGFPTMPPCRPGFISSYGPGTLSHWRARLQPITELARRLSLGGAGGAGRQVIDKTGLTGKFDFTLVYDMHLGAATDDNPSPVVFDAVEKQLGLELVDDKAPFDFFVVERAERVPLEN